MNSKRWFILLGMALAVLSANTLLAADNIEDIRTELNKAREEIQQLRSELDELKNQSTWKYQAELNQALKSAPAAAKEEAGGVLKLPAGWSIQPYGYFKFDMSYDDSAVNGAGGDYIISVKPENNTTRGDDAFSITVRQTRLGTKIFAPNIGDLKVMGRVEIDFYNPVTDARNENKSTPQMRHAYGELTGNDWSVIFGQTSDVVSPLNPSTLNYTVGWFGGNTGYRHPQLRFTKWWACANDSQFKVETALSRDINSNKGSGVIDDGQDTGVPTVLGRLSYALPLAGRKMVAGVSGHYGQEEIDWAEVGDDDNVNTWSVNADLVVPVSEKVELKGEVFWAENFDSYFGGIGQGVNDDASSRSFKDEIETMGAWAQVGYKPNSEWAFHTGGGLDDPIDGDLAEGDASHNFFAFTNANYYFSKYLSTGVELTYWRTDYKNTDDGDNFRIQHSWKLSF